MDEKTSLWKFGDNPNYGIMGYDIPIEALYECTTTDVRGYTPTDEDENTLDTKAYSTTGVFKYSDELKNKRFYVVAVTSNNCRTISPLYDYRGKIEVSIFVALFETISTDTETESGYSYDRNAKLGIHLMISILIILINILLILLYHLNTLNCYLLMKKQKRMKIKEYILTSVMKWLMFCYKF